MIHTDPVLNATVSRANPVFTNSLFSIMLTAGGGGTSALSVNASAALNGVYIVCSDGNGLTSDIQEAVAIVAGEWDCYIKKAKSSSLQQVFSHWSHTYGRGMYWKG